MGRTKHVFVGGGIASLSGAVILIRDHGVDGSDIVILEAGLIEGGSLDGTKTGDGAFVVRGARMLEANYRCTLDLMSSIPSPDLPGETLAADFWAFNSDHPVPHTCIPVTQGGVGRDPGWQLPRRHVRAVLSMLLRSEARLDGKRICDVLERDFFESDMWLVFSTAFAFQPWHSAAELRRYMRRFLDHGQSRAHNTNMVTTRYNQTDSLIGPIRTWLADRGVSLRTGETVTDAIFEETSQWKAPCVTTGGERRPATASPPRTGSISPSAR